MYDGDKKEVDLYLSILSLVLILKRQGIPMARIKQTAPPAPHQPWEATAARRVLAPPSAGCHRCFVRSVTRVGLTHSFSQTLQYVYDFSYIPKVSVYQGGDEAELHRMQTQG